MGYCGTLFNISAPSGAGKTSLVQAIVQSMNDIAVSVSHTTRPIRPGETQGVDYYYVSTSEFDELKSSGAFIEDAEVFGHQYGTSKKWLQEQLSVGTDVILEIDWQGARKVRAIIPEVVNIFIMPPSRDALKMRLVQRARDPQDVVTKRLKKAAAEMAHYDEYDFVIINDEFATAVADLQAIIRSRRLRLKQQQQKYPDLLEKLISIE